MNIVLLGIDGAGKSTISFELKKILEEKGFTVEIVPFHKWVFADKIRDRLGVGKLIDKDRKDRKQVYAPKKKSFSAFIKPPVALIDNIIYFLLKKSWKKKKVVIFAAGTGNPFFTTDTAATLRAAEMNCDALMKGTQVDGVYDKDPFLHKDARRFKRLGYMRIMRGLKVMDSTAASLCRDNDIPIIVLNLLKKGNVERAIVGKKVGTLITDRKSRRGK